MTTSSQRSPDSYSFAAFIKAAKNCSPILEPQEIADYIEHTDYEPLLLFLHRIAAFVASDIKNSNEFRSLDDSDFIDAAQECTVDMLTIIKANPAKFSGYAAVTFRRRIRRYLSGVNNGGLGGYASDAERPMSLIERAYDEDEEDIPQETQDGIETPIGLGDPLTELIRLETVEAALESLERPAKGTHGPKWDTIARNRRVEKYLGSIH